MRLSQADTNNLCLNLDPCICELCAHGHHDTCNGHYTTYSDTTVRCRCTCNRSCKTCGAGPNDECHTGCTHTEPPPTETHTQPQRLIDILN